MIEGQINLLRERKEAIFAEWYEAILSSYPSEAKGYWRVGKDPFANPAGNIIREATNNILKYLLEESDKDEMMLSLKNFIRLRAVHDLSPSKALEFIIFLKEIIRKDVENNTARSVNMPDLIAELRVLELKIDKLLLVAFDIYAECRQKVYEIRVNEVKRLTFGLLKESNLLSDMPD